MSQRMCVYVLARHYRNYIEYSEKMTRLLGFLFEIIVF